MMFSLLGILLVALLAAALLTGRLGPTTTVPGVVVDAVFLPDRAADGRTRLTVRTDDGRTFVVHRPGRHALAAGDPVQVVLAGTRIRRVVG